MQAAWKMCFVTFMTSSGKHALTLVWVRERDVHEQKGRAAMAWFDVGTLARKPRRTALSIAGAASRVRATGRTADARPQGRQAPGGHLTANWITTFSGSVAILPLLGHSYARWSVCSGI